MFFMKDVFFQIFIFSYVYFISTNSKLFALFEVRFTISTLIAGYRFTCGQ